VGRSAVRYRLKDEYGRERLDEIRVAVKFEPALGVGNERLSVIRREFRKREKLLDMPISNTLILKAPLFTRLVFMSGMMS